MCEVRGDTAKSCNPRRRLNTGGLALLTSLVYEARLIELFIRKRGDPIELNYRKGATTVRLQPGVLQAAARLDPL